MEDYYEYLDSNGVTTLYKLIKDDTVALIDSYSVTINGITTTLDNHVNNTDIHTPIADIENMVDTKVSGLVNSAPETLDTLKELSDALGNDTNFATTVANQIGNKASKDSVYTKEETNTLLEGKANSVHNHVVKDITDFPTIPTKVSELNNDSNFVTSTELHDYATKNDLNSKQDALSEEQLSNIDSIPDKANTSDLAVVAKSGNYNDLNNTPTIPTKTSQLINDSGFLTSSSGVITSVSWSDITDKPNFSTVATSGSYKDLSNKPTIPKVYNKTLTIQKNGTNVATFTSNSNTDVTADITVPTKVSELSNDSGFITGISWDKVTNKPTLATVATSGSYTDLSNTPTIPTKVSQLENDMGFGTGGDTSDCVHKTGNETIDGIKTFTSGPWVTNNGTTIGFSIKNTAICRGEVPSELYHNTFRAYDKNGKILGEYCVEKSTTGCSLLNMNVRSEDSNGNQLSESLYLNMSNDGSTVRFYPSSDNKVDLGMSNHKWAKVYSDDVVHTRGVETIAGTKKFTSDVARKYTAVDITTTPTSDMYAHFNFTDKNDKTVAYIQYAQKSNGVDYIGLRVRDKNSNTWGVQINTNKEFVPLGNSSYSLGSATYKWGKIYSDDVVHTSGDETIDGMKTFNNSLTFCGNVDKKNNDVDRSVTPSSDISSNFVFLDKNSSVLGFLNHTHKADGVNHIGLYVKDSNNGTHGFRVTTNNVLLPLSNNAYSLGSSSYKWEKVYSDDIVHTSGTETISGYKKFTNNVYMKNNSIDLTSTPSEDKLSLYGFIDKNEKTLSSIQYVQRTTGVNDLSLFVRDKDSGLHGIQLNTNNELRPRVNNVYSLGSSNLKWKNVYATTFNGNLSGTIASSTTATTQATTDNSTKIATTAWVRTYVNSVVGSGSIGASISAYYSNATTVTAEKSSLIGSGSFPDVYSDYINIAPTVGTIYTGSQLFSSFIPTASGIRSDKVHQTTAVATATFRGAFSPSAKYLCTTAKAVRFRAYVSKGTISDIGTASVVNNSSAKSIFIRVQ